VTVRVEPEGEPPFKATFKQAFPNDLPHPGQVAKVIYDPSKRSKIAVVADTLSWGDGPLEVSIGDGPAGEVTAGPDQLMSFFAGGGTAAPDVADQLTKLADLRDRGALSEAEFQAQKRELLGS
jgi:hypothetical protein